MTNAVSRLQKRVVLASGVFDLLHLGHVRYLEEAARQGDELVVSVTSDRYAAKAPGRPVFTAAERAEMVGALECVTHVVISDAPTAIEVIEQVRPAVYVKGREYEGGKGDIAAEIAAVEAFGGRMHFATTPTMSSSSLINGHVVEPELRAYLASAKARGFADKIPDMVERIKDLRVLFIGETIIDEYVYVTPLGKPSKEFIVCGREQGREEFRGGVVAAANHARSFVKSVHVVSAKHVRKTRFVDPDSMRKLFEVYRMDDSPLRGAEEAALAHQIQEECAEADVVVVTDFGHGMMTSHIRKTVEGCAKFLAVNTQTNAGNHGFNLITKYGWANYICLDAPEVRLALGDAACPIGTATIDLAGRRGVARMAVTHGRNGSTMYGQSGLATVPAFTTKAVDTMGAGDAFLAVTAPLASVADDMEVVGFIGNIVGALKVGIVGHRASVDKDTVLRHAATLLK